MTGPQAAMKICNGLFSLGYMHDEKARQNNDENERMLADEVLKIAIALTSCIGDGEFE